MTKDIETKRYTLDIDTQSIFDGNSFRDAINRIEDYLSVARNRGMVEGTDKLDCSWDTTVRLTYEAPAE